MCIIIILDTVLLIICFDQLLKASIPTFKSYFKHKVIMFVWIRAELAKRFPFLETKEKGKSDSSSVATERTTATDVASA